MPEHTPLENTPRQVSCPTCGGPSFYHRANRYRPFCSDRCRQNDFGAWASERFALPEQASDRDPRFEKG